MCSFDVCLCVCVFLSVCVQQNSQTSLQWELYANSSKTVKAMDFIFDVHVPRDSPDMTP